MDGKESEEESQEKMKGKCGGKWDFPGIRTLLPRQLLSGRKIK